MIIKPKVTKKDIIKRIQDSAESNVFLYEPVSTSSLSELVSVLRRLFTYNSYLSIIVVKNK